ncbi:MAG: 4-alpha-glucanotransferase [Clostridia bacterium]|nr:4-alpha-glucanotransferase [Clostridia bacterium]
MGKLKNFGFKHKAGILMPISALPNKYGIGSFGREAHKFVDFLYETGQKCWQVLPLNPTSYGDSPYQSPASGAGNPYFIDLDVLSSKGLLTKEELKGQRNNDKKVNYGRLFETRYEVLRTAFSRFKPNAEYRAFLRKNASWIEDYALFMALKVKNNYASFTLWNECERDYKQARESSSQYESEMAFWRWVQFEFDAQWKHLRDYAKKKGIVLIGDMPIYVAHDSADVWASREQFLLDESYNPTLVAGVPPDAFSETGQLWGNPIYNWEKMKNDGFEWWLDRIGRAFELYDIVRIDHFRGFAGYYTIPFGDETAVNGWWNEAPGQELFEAVNERFPSAKIIAEDLGVITDDVKKLLSDCDFPGMKMLPFAFFDENSDYIPRNYKSENCVVYTSSHDSDCARSWVNDLTGDARKLFNRERRKIKGENLVCSVIRLAFESKANLAVVQMQDYLYLNNEEGRMNMPSTPSGNWGWRMSPRYNTKALRDKISALTKETKRR